jgi:hypothetical protein
MPRGNQQNYNKEQKELIGSSFLDLMLHEVFGLPPAIRTDFISNLLDFAPLPANATAIHQQFYWAAHNAKCHTVTALMDCIAKEQPNHKCLLALQFFKTLYAKEGLVGVADFLIRNLPKERCALEKISLDSGEKRCLLHDNTRDAAVRHSRRSFLWASTVMVPAIGLIYIADEVKQDIKARLYTHFRNSQENPGRSPSNQGISRRELLAGRTNTLVPNERREDGITVFDLHPSPFSSSKDNVLIHVEVGKTHLYYAFPSDKTGRALQHQYVWMHQTVQPVGVLMALGAAAMSTIHLGGLAYRKNQRKRAANELVEPLCQVFSGVMNALDAQAAKEAKRPERG